VQLVDAKGQTVAVPLSEFQDSGDYSVDIPTDMLSSGVYQLVFKSATHSATQPVNIVK
jgi:hypothetical protein